MPTQYKYGNRNKRSNKGGFYRSKPAFLLYLIVIAAVVLAVLEVTNATHFFHRGTPATQVITRAGTSGSAPQPNVSATHPTAPKGSSGSGNTSGSVIQGGATDTSGQTQASTNPSQWITAKSGNITVKQPVANATLQNGDSLVGNAKVSQVNYRLIDNQLGVVAQGTLNVVNGNFSGILHFGHKASNGRLDVFSTNDQGVELNEIQIAVNF